MLRAGTGRSRWGHRGREMEGKLTPHPLFFSGTWQMLLKLRTIRKFLPAFTAGYGDVWIASPAFIRHRSGSLPVRVHQPPVFPPAVVPVQVPATSNHS